MGKVSKIRTHYSVKQLRKKLAHGLLRRLNDSSKHAKQFRLSKEGDYYSLVANNSSFKSFSTQISFEKDEESTIVILSTHFNLQIHLREMMNLSIILVFWILVSILFSAIAMLFSGLSFSSAMNLFIVVASPAAMIVLFMIGSVISVFFNYLTQPLFGHRTQLRDAITELVEGDLWENDSAGQVVKRLNS